MAKQFNSKSRARIAKVVKQIERDGGDRGGKRRRRRPREVDFIDIRPTGATPIPGAFNRWSYSWVEVEPVKQGSYQDKPAGRTSTSTGWPAYNIIEANNTETGTQGNSIDPADLPAGSTILPVSGPPVLHAWVILNCDREREVHFQYENAVDPTCEP